VGKIAYEAYIDFCIRNEIMGENCFPTWNNCPSKIREAWDEVAQVLQKAKGGHIEKSPKTIPIRKTG